MYKIKALNRDSVSDDDAPVIRKEAQEENALTKYNNALKFQYAGNLEEAEALLQSLLDNDIPEIENRGGLPKTMSTLKYSCCLNIGTIATKGGNKQKALDYYAQASELDKTDVTLWFKIGSLAIELDHFKQSAYALSKGLDCNKNHWPCLDKLIMLLYAMRDTVSCLHYVSRGLQLDPDYVRGLMLRKRIYEKNPGTQEYYQLFNPDYIYDPPLNTEFDEVEGKELEKESNDISERIHNLELAQASKPLPVLSLSKPLQEFTWVSLGQSIIHMHHYISDNNLSFICRVNLLESMKSADTVESLPPEEPVKFEEEIEAKTSGLENVIFNEDKAGLTSKEKEAEGCEQESDIASEAPDIASDDTETEAEKDEKQPSTETEMCNDDENLFSTQNSKSDSHEDANALPDSPDEETETKKSEGENVTESKECSGSKTESSGDKTSTSVGKIEGGSEEKSKSKTPNRRRRNSLSFLQPWAWHSKRKSSKKVGKNDKDDTIEGTLRRIIPNNILPNGLKSDRCKQLSSFQDDSLNTMDLYKLFMEDQEQEFDRPQFLMELDDPKKYFGTQQETEDIEAFWKYNWERCDIIAMVEKYVITLANLWEYKWPEALKDIYIEAYEMYREHFDHPHVFSTDVEFSELKCDTEITILYSELIFDCVQDCISKNKSVANIKRLPCSSLNTMDLVCTRKTDWGPDYMKICLRLYWLKSNIYITEMKNDLAIRSLHSLKYFINSTEKPSEFHLHLPNCVYNSVITLKNTEKLVQSLEMLQKLGTVETLFENKCYEEVIKILQENFKLKAVSKYKTKVDGPVQIVMLLHALWLTNRQECLLWSEICLNESLPMYFKTHAQPDSFEHKRWSLVVVKCMVMMEACIKEENIVVLDCLKEVQTRLVENLASIICHQLNSKSLENSSKVPLETVKPWILLHYVLQREEHRVQARRSVRHCKNSDDSDDEQHTPSVTKSDDSEEDDEKDVPASVSILFSAHDFLGRRGWCLESSGELLLFLVDVILYRLNAPIFEGIRDKIEIHLEQAFFCLYQHPSKKNKVSRHLADHNVDPLPLTWDRAQQLYEFYQPKALPEFDSYRYSSISSEMEQLLQRILSLVPAENDPQQNLLQDVTAYINGKVEIMPDSLTFPHKVLPIYYLLGDYYLKLHDPAKGLKYFLLDLCINSTRLDTWADMALAMASQLETKLNHCETFRSESEFLDKVRSAQICFKQSLHLSSGHAMLWIEYGNFVYMAHSFCSRLLKGDTDMLSMEKFEVLESQKEAMLDAALECFTAANIAWQVDPGEHDERWLHHYMLGKIAEKKKQDPSVYLDHYNKAGKLLFENKATYPLKINYSNPQHLSVEALEIHYRIHASILKYLELHEDKPILRSLGKVFQKYLKESDNGLFSKVPSRTDIQPSESLKRPGSELEQAVVKKRRLSEVSVQEEVASVLEDLLARVESDLNRTGEKKQQTDDVVMILDSDEDASLDNKGAAEAKTQPTEAEVVKFPRIRVRNAQEIMDDMMKKCMANQPEYKSETETDIEMEVEKATGGSKSAQNENLQKSSEPVSSPSRRGSTTSTAATTTTSTSDSSDSSSSDDSSNSSSSDSESSETESSKQSSSVSGKKIDNSPMAPDEIKKLIDQSLLSLEQCISRFPQNYKALYRLTHFYLNNKCYRNLSKCRQLMLTEYKCTDSTIVTGLFSDRRSNNFFNGVWRIPTSEIDRPGSFASHMSRCVQLLMQVLRDIDDHKTLLDLCLMLRRTPDPDKIYIRDSERIQLSDQALTICIQSLRGMIKRLVSGKSVYTEPELQIFPEGDVTVKVMLDVYRAYQKVQKHLAHKESVFSGLLTDAYKHYMQNKVPEGSNVLDLAIKFCQQRKLSVKTTVQQQQPVVAAQVKSTVAPTPTLQSPVQTSPVQPLRKSAKTFSGRPRGRPPNINKHLSGLKSTKGMRDSSFFPPPNPYAWQNLLYSSTMGGNLDPKLALNYMMSKYQEELIRQYSQLGQNSLLTNPFAVNPLIPPSVLASSSLPSAHSAESDKTPVASSSKTLEVKKPVELKKNVEPKKVPQEKKDPPSKVVGSSNVRYSKETNKAYYVDSSKDYSGDITLFKDRPGISITPIHQGSQPHVSSSPTKTLQQKLAERQKQNPAALQKVKPVPKVDTTSSMMFTQFQGYSKNMSFAKPNIPLPPVPHGSKLLSATSSNKMQSSHYKNLAKNIPPSLTIMKSQPSGMMPLQDSGISISQVNPQQSTLYKGDTSNKIMSFRKPSAPKLKLGSRKLGSDITVTPNYKDTAGVTVPLSLSISKMDDGAKSDGKKDDSVEIITIE